MPIEHSAVEKSLPVSPYPLVSFDSLTILRRKALQSLVIAMPPHHLPTDPSATLFQPPIQVVVLGIEGKQVKLGVYANSFLEFQQGPPPNATWLQHWKNEHPKNDTK